MPNWLTLGGSVGDDENGRSSVIALEFGRCVLELVYCVESGCLRWAYETNLLLKLECGSGHRRFCVDVLGIVLMNGDGDDDNGDGVGDDLMDLVKM